ncbi:MAG: putative porin [Prevotellaceae bacterium]|nr:putative porin [Prevotellaceae bacterium]
MCSVSSLEAQALKGEDPPVRDTTATALPDSTATADSSAVAIPDSTTVMLPDSLPTTDTTAVIIPDNPTTVDSTAIPVNEKKTKHADDTTTKEKRIVLQLESFMFDTMLVKSRMFSWQVNRYTGAPVMTQLDTMINDHLIDLPFYNNDVGATYLGVSGSAALTFNYFLRPAYHYLYPLTFYDAYRTTPDNIQFFNTRAPFTRFTYNGTLFANRNFEQTDLDILHTQNITPELNAGLMYRRYGGNGLLTNEGTDSRTFTLFASYSGKRYAAHAGYIFNRSTNKHNGGVYSDGDITDTIIDARVIQVNLKKASEKALSHTYFLTHSYGVPLNFFRKNADTLRAGSGTMVYFGNSIEYTTAYRTYTDEISESDSTARKYYHNTFNYFNPFSTPTKDSMRSSLLDARLFASLQPFEPDFIISKILGGAGYRYLNNYYFKPTDYLRPISDNIQHNIFWYANAWGTYQHYFSWSAFIQSYLTGYYQNDLFFKADATMSLYPLPKGIHLHGSISIDLHTPDYFLQNYYSNHLKWDNNFVKTKETKIEVSVGIPDWHVKATGAYSLLFSPVVFNTLAMPIQPANDEEINIATVTLTHDAQVWLLHLDSRIMGQYTDHKDIISIPELSLNEKFYLQYELVKNVMTMQFGADAYFNTPYKMYAYNPAAGAFHLQDKTDIGSFVYVDVFLNFKWKKATLFVKYVNLGQEWGNRMYFSALHYIRPQNVVQFGLSWPFYL